LPQTIKNNLEVLAVLILTCLSHKNVVDIHCHKIEIAEDFVHMPLKSLRCIPETKFHHIKLEDPVRCDDSGLFSILRCEWNLMVGADQVDGGEYGPASEDLVDGVDV